MPILDTIVKQANQAGLYVILALFDNEKSGSQPSSDQYRQPMDPLKTNPAKPSDVSHPPYVGALVTYLDTEKDKPRRKTTVEKVLDELDTLPKERGRRDHLSILQQGA
jgi:hypothetical protein